MVRKVPPVYYQMMMHCMDTDKYVFVRSYPKFGGETFLPIVDVELGESLVPVLVRDFGERNIDISVHKVYKIDEFKNIKPNSWFGYELYNLVIVDLDEYVDVTEISLTNGWGYMTVSWDKLVKMKNELLYGEPLKVAELFDAEQKRRIKAGLAA